MSDLSKLKATLKQAAVDGIKGPRAMPFAAPELGAALILDAVDGSVMGRRITVSAGGSSGKALMLDASGRRLQRVAGPVPEHFAIRADVELKSSDAAALAAGLMAFCEGQSDLRITTQPIADAGDPAEGGIVPDLVREVLGLSPGGAETEIDPEADLHMEPFINALAPDCHAALWLQGEDVSLLVGDEARASRLSDWAAPMLEQLLAPEFPLAASMETDGIMVFVMPDSAERHTLIAGRLGAYLVAEVKGRDPSASIAAWHKARS